MKTRASSYSKIRGFTVVEMIIVVIVIGLLATVTLVVYRGTQERSRYSVMQQDLSGINKALQLYFGDNSKYPSFGGGSTGCVTANSSQTLTLDGIVPIYMAKIPIIPNDGLAGYYAYCVNASQSEYKLVRLVPGGVTLPSPEQSDTRPDAARAGRGWGFWSTGGSAL